MGHQQRHCHLWTRHGACMKMEFSELFSNGIRMRAYGYEDAPVSDL